MNHHSITSQPLSPIPTDDLQRKLAVARPNEDLTLPHIGLAGDTYTILLSGKDTDGRYCLIDMHIPPGGGPPPHRHDFEESFTLLEGVERNAIIQMLKETGGNKLETAKRLGIGRQTLYIKIKGYGIDA